MLSALCFSLVCLGLLGLIAGYIPARKICQLIQSTSWQLLSYLILGFITGYIAVLTTLLHQNAFGPLLLILSLMLLFGGGFVYLVVTNSLKAIQQLHDLAVAEHHNATHDTLTGIPNRKYFVETISALISEKQMFDLMLFDVANFKQVNDGMGHHCGDQLLIQITSRIAKLIGPNDCFARIGGDEFVLILPNSDDQKSAFLATQIHQQLANPIEISGYRLSASVVIGLSRFPYDGDSSDEILNHADLAMYHAKSSGRLLSVFDASMKHDAAKHIRLSQQLDRAIAEGGFEIHYQPIFDGNSLSLEGYEALIRCRTPQGEWLTPEDFIVVAEQSNQISKITRWILNQVTQDIRVLSKHGIELAVHVNLSAKDLLGSTLVDQLSSLVTQMPNLSQRLILEITESAAINRLRQPERLFEKLRRLGFSISLDDFGTGFSSLSLLRDLPVDQIKIDRSFVVNIHTSHKDHAIVENTIALAHGLGYSVVAEGISHQETVILLQRMQCDFMQGFYFMRPRPLNEIIQWTHGYQPTSILND